MKASTKTIFAIAATGLFLVVFFGFALPFLFSAASTEAVWLGMILLLAFVIALVMKVRGIVASFSSDQ